DNRLRVDFGPDGDAGLLPPATPVASGAGTIWLPINIADGGFQILSNSRTDSYGKVLTDSGSLFGQANWNIDERWVLTMGLRGTYEEKEGRARRLEPEAAVRYTTPPFSGVQDQQIGPWDSDDHGGLKLHEFSPSALLTLSWKVADDHLLYAT